MADLVSHRKWRDRICSLFRGQWAAAGSGADIVQVRGFGNRVVLRDRPRLRLTRYEGLYRRIGDDTETGEPQEIDVIRPFTRAIELVGRDDELDALWAWLRSDSPVSVRVLTGDAGLGKTRLALELVDRAGEEGWSAGFLEPRELTRFLGQDLSTWGWDKPVLIVGDDASASSGGFNQFFRQLANRRVWDEKEDEKGRGPRLRVLLLERHATPGKGWWAGVFGAEKTLERMLEPREPVPLQPIGEPARRREILERTLSRLNRGPVALEKGELERRLAELPKGGVPLVVMMAGATMTRGDYGAVFALGPGALALTVAQRELERVHRVAGVDASLRPFVEHMVAVATLRGGLTRDGALVALEEEAAELGYELPLGAAPLRNALAQALPGDEDGVGGVGPDMIGEAVLLRVWSGSDDGRAAVRRAYEQDPNAVVGTVVRTCQDYRSHESSEPLKWLETIVVGIGGDGDALMVLASAIPELTVELRESAVDLWRSIVDLIEPLARDSREAETRGSFARSLGCLSIRLSAFGLPREALAAVEEALALQRGLAAEDGSFRHDLAVSLHQRAKCLGDAGRFREALLTAEESLALARDLASSDAAAKHILAIALNNLAAFQRQARQYREALALAEEAVTLHRELVSQDPGVFRLGLAKSLRNLSLVLSFFDQQEKAVAAVEEAVSISRQLAAEAPDAFRPDLADSLQQLSAELSCVDRDEEALAAGEEAVELLRELRDTVPGVFEPNLATSLGIVSQILSEGNRNEEALLAVEEAVSIGRDLLEVDPEAHRAGLASLLLKQYVCLSETGRHEETLEVVEEAVAIRRDLAKSDPEMYGEDLALSLAVLSIVLSAGGRLEEALAANGEIVAIRRDLAQSDPGVYRRELAVSLYQQSLVLSVDGRDAEALAAVEESVAILRDLAQFDASTDRERLATSLDQMSVVLLRASGTGEGAAAVASTAGALAAVEESVAIRRELAQSDPGTYRKDLAGSLGQQSVALAAAGRNKEACTGAEETVAIRRDLARRDPAAHRRGLASSLHNLTGYLSHVGRSEEALVAIEESVAIRRDLVSADPLEVPELAESLISLAACLTTCGYGTALAAAEEAAEYLRHLAAAHPGPFLGGLARALAIRSACLRAAGRWEDALVPSGEAVDILRGFATSGSVASVTLLAQALGDSSRCLLAAGRPEAAADAVAEAIEWLREPFLLAPGVVAERMAGIVSLYFEVFAAAGRDPDDGLLGPIVQALKDAQYGEETPGQATT